MNKRITLWFFYLLTIGSAFSAWWFIFSSFKGDFSFRWTPQLIAFCVFLLSMPMVAFIANKKVILIALISLAPCVLISANLASIIPLLLSLGLFALAVKRIKNFRQNSIKLNIGRAILVGYSLITTAFFLVIASTYFFIFKEKDIHQNLPNLNFEIPQTVSSVAFRFLYNSLGDQLDINDPELTVNEFLNSSLNDRFSQEQKTVSPSLDQQREQLSQQLGIALRGEEKMYEVLNKYLNKKAQDYFKAIEELDDISAAGLALGVFLTLKAFGLFIRTPLSLINTLIFKILVQLDMLRIVRKNKAVETIL